MNRLTLLRRMGKIHAAKSKKATEEYLCVNSFYKFQELHKLVEETVDEQQLEAIAEKTNQWANANPSVSEDDIQELFNY